MQNKLIAAYSRSRFWVSSTSYEPHWLCVYCVCLRTRIREHEATEMAAESNNLEEILRPFYQRASEAEVFISHTRKKIYIWFLFDFLLSLYCVFVWVCVLELILLAFFLIECYFWCSLYDSSVFWCSCTGIQEWYSNLDSWTF